MNRRRLPTLAALFVATVLATGQSAFAPAPAQARSDWAPRVAVIVGPVGSLTSEYRQIAREAAAEARRWTPDVVTAFSPNATWPAVRSAITGASVVIYLGHGNGWPSPHRSALYDVTQNGFGLNPVAGAGDDTHQYFGADSIRREVKLAPGAVVLLHRLCYASGNSEPGVPEGTLEMARQRVDNFAAGFLYAGAGAVVADAFASPASYLRQLLGRGAPAITAWRNSPTANGNTFSFASDRTPGALAFMDPDNGSSGFYRSIVLASRTAQTTGPGGVGTGFGTSVPSAVAPTIVLPADPPVPSLAALGAISGPPVFADRPIAATTTTLSVPLRLPAGAKLPTGLQVGVRWTPIDLSPVVSSGPAAASPAPPTTPPGPAATPGGAPDATASPTPGPTPTASPAGPTQDPGGNTGSAGGAAAGAAARAAALGPPGPALAALAPIPRPSAAPRPAPAPSPSAPPTVSPSASPTVSPAASPTVSPAASPTVSPARSPSASPTVSPAPSPGLLADSLGDADEVVPELASSAVEVAPATLARNALRLAVRLPTAPGRYRVVVTLHGSDGVALDAQTQALVPALIVRVAGPIEVSYRVPARSRAFPASAMRLMVTVTNAGTLSWSQAADPRSRTEGVSIVEGPNSMGRRPVLVARWLPLDPGGSVADAPEAETPFDAPPGKSAAVLLSLRAPSAPGAYLVVLDVRSPVYGSLTARGAAPATVIVTVRVPAP